MSGKISATIIQIRFIGPKITVCIQCVPFGIFVMEKKTQSIECINDHIH